MTAVPRKKPWIPPLGFGDRLRLTRLEYARRSGARIGTKEMAALLGVPASTYGGWEGGSPVRNLYAIALLVARRTGVDEDWLLRDQTGPLDPDPAPSPVVDKQSAAPRDTTPETTAKRASNKAPLGRSAPSGQKNLEEPMQDPYIDID